MNSGRRLRLLIITAIVGIGQLVTGVTAAHAALTINEYQGPDTVGTEDIVTGPDGNLWATQFAANQISKISPAGAYLANYTVPTASSHPLGIAAGPDGNLWFTEESSGKVARLTTTGVFTEYSLPVSTNEPEGITVGPDCNLWFVEFFPAKIARITTSGQITEFPLPQISRGPMHITSGSDGNLWFSEYQGNMIGRITPTGTITEFPVDTTAGVGGGSPDAVALGWDGNVWFTMDNSHAIGKVTPGGSFTYFPESGLHAAVDTGMGRGPDGTVWFTDPPNNAVGEITTSGVIGEQAVPSPSASPQGITTGPDGDVWFAEFGTGKVGQVVAPVTDPPGPPRNVTAYAGDGSAVVTWDAPFYDGGAAITGFTVTPFVGTSAQTPVTVAGSPAAITGLTNGTTYTFRVSATNSAGTGFPSCPCGTATTPSALQSAVSTKQYMLANSDGSAWVDIDPANLRLNISPNVASVAVLGGNADLWTANAGFNQDIGIFVSVNGGPDQLVTWKESGGFAGTFSPNAAFAQGVYNISPGTLYVFKLKWKAHKNAIGATIFAGAGPIAGQFSPTRLTAQLLAPTSVLNASSSQQYPLANSDGVSWTEIDPANLEVTSAPAAGQTAILGGNADLWTANAGFNQDIAIFVSVNNAPDQLVAWKESGGFAGTFSPNAAFVQGVYQLSSGNTYVFKLKWKTSKNAGGASIFAGAGPIAGQFSPTRLSAIMVSPTTNALNAASGQQYHLANSDGSSWVEPDPTNLELNLPGASTAFALVSVNADLWTANAGFNQDVAIFVSVNAGPDQLVAWKESGGFAGTFSPNAAFVQGVYPISSGNTYVFKIKWKTSKSASGATIWAGAGPISSQFSPTRLAAQIMS